MALVKVHSGSSLPVLAIVVATDLSIAMQLLKFYSAFALLVLCELITEMVV